MEEKERKGAVDVTPGDSEQFSAAAMSRTIGHWWCSCGHCQQMPTEEESLCCRQWDLSLLGNLESFDVSVDKPTSSAFCLTKANKFPHLIHLGILEMFFHIPKINWKGRPGQEGRDGIASYLRST